MPIIKERKKYNAIEKCLYILSLFSINNTHMNINEICNKTKFNKTTAYRIMQTLSQSGYVIRTNDNTYCIGAKPLYLSLLANSEQNNDTIN
jgi:DNA-binding IclR family transcriptional regulator